MEKFTELKAWCQKVIPLVYDDSLSYYEFLCKILKKLNDLGISFNQFVELLEIELNKRPTKEFINNNMKLSDKGDFKGTWFGVPFNNSSAGMTSDWNASKNGYPTLAERLKYMSMLIEQNVDNIEEIIPQLLTKAEQSSILNLQSQIDNLVINGTGDSNPEVIQARTDFLGNTFNTLKDNMNNMQNLLYNDYSLLSYSDWVQGAIQNDGTTNDLKTYIRTNDFHYINQLTEITPMEGIELRIAIYDSAGVIDSIKNFSNAKIVLIPNSTRKYKFCLRKVDGSDITPLENTKLQMKFTKHLKYNVEGANYIKVSQNMIDQADLIQGYVLNASTGEPEPNSLYDTTPFLDYRLGQKLYCSRYRSYIIYDADKNKILVNTAETQEKSEVFYNPNSNLRLSNAMYIRFSFRKPYGNDAMVSLTDYTEFKQGGYFIPHLKIQPRNFSTEFTKYIDDLLSIISASVSNPLLGKKLLVLGDSIITGNEVGGNGIGERIKNLNEMTLIKRSLGGATMAVVSGSTNNIVNQVNNSISNNDNPDYIIFNGLTNDIGSPGTIQLGTITNGFNASLDTSTFSGAMEYVLKSLINAYPSAKILYLRPHNMSSRNSQKQIDFGNRALEIIKKYSKRYIDLYNDGGLNTNITTLRNLYTVNSDGTHYNDDGYELFLVNQVNATLKTL